MTARSEVIIEVDGREVRLLFTNRALAEIEAQTGKTVIALANGFSAGNTGVTEVAVMLRAGLEAVRRSDRGGGKHATLDDAYDLMDEIGFAEAASKVMTAVAEVIGFSAEAGSPNG